MPHLLLDACFVQGNYIWLIRRIWIYKEALIMHLKEEIHFSKSGTTIVLYWYTTLQTTGI